MQTFFGQLLKQKYFKSCGGAGYRSRYLSHAKRALYHLSYAPNLINWATLSIHILIQLNSISFTARLRGNTKWAHFGAKQGLSCIGWLQERIWTSSWVWLIVCLGNPKTMKADSFCQVALYIFVVVELECPPTVTCWDTSICVLCGCVCILQIHYL